MQTNRSLRVAKGLASSLDKHKLVDGAWVPTSGEGGQQPSQALRAATPAERSHEVMRIDNARTASGGSEAKFEDVMRRRLSAMSDPQKLLNFANALEETSHTMSREARKKLTGMGYGSEGELRAKVEVKPVAVSPAPAAKPTSGEGDSRRAGPNNAEGDILDLQRISDKADPLKKLIDGHADSVGAASAGDDLLAATRDAYKAVVETLPKLKTIIEEAKYLVTTPSGRAAVKSAARLVEVVADNLRQSWRPSSGKHQSLNMLGDLSETVFHLVDIDQTESAALSEAKAAKADREAAAREDRRKP